MNSPYPAELCTTQSAHKAQDPARLNLTLQLLHATGKIVTCQG